MATMQTANLTGRDFLSDQDFSPDALLALLELARDLKALARQGVRTPLLEGDHLAMICEEPSAGARISFELGMRELGGEALQLRLGEAQPVARESIHDTARVLSRHCHAIAASLTHHEDIVKLARGATIPVVNGLTDVDDPVQTMSDALTIMERFERVHGVRLAFIGAATSVCNSLALTGTHLGMHVVVAGPPPHRVSREIELRALENAEASGGSFRWTDDPLDAVREADVVYTDAWSPGPEQAEALARAMGPFQVNAALMARAPAQAVFMHCLPAARGREVTGEVIDSPQSIVFDQAENRLHLEKALLAALIGVSPELELADERVADLAARIGRRERPAA